MLVGGVVITYDVQLAAGVSPGDELEEVQELDVGVPVVTGVGDLACRDLEGGEQARGAVALVVVGLLLGQARSEREDGSGSVQCLDLSFRAPRGAASPDGGGRTPSLVCRSRPVKLRAA